jgi:nucleoside-diphosphate-sugar epimerase
MKASISILGCGWLGLALGEQLQQQGYRVQGSVTSQEASPALAAAGIRPTQLVLSPELRGENTDSFFDCQVLIINFPPERRPDIEDFLPAQIQSLIAQILKHGIPKVLFVSSTSVYPDVNREVYEGEPLSPAKSSGRALKLAEELLLTQTAFKTTVLRLGGLVGYDRLPGTYLASKKEVSNGDVPLNVIHRDDCVAIIEQLIRQDVWGEVFNACADEHPLRKEYYTLAAQLAGLATPVFISNGPSQYKLVNSEKLKAHLGYTFHYPDPLKMLFTAESAQNPTDQPPH